MSLSPFSRPLVLSMALATGCAVGPDYEPPTAEPPTTWSEVGKGMAETSADLRDWWKQLGDERLDQLVERAILANLDLRLAMSRLDQARALRAQAAGGRWPTLDGRAGYTKSTRSSRTNLGTFGFRNDELYSAGVDAAWELDLWGRVRRTVEAADADLDVAVAEQQASLVTVIAEVVFEYLELRSAQRRLAIAQRNLTLQEQSRDLVAVRVRTGLAAIRESEQAESNVATTRSRLPQLRTLARAAENRLAVLLGEAPGSLATELREDVTIPVAPVEVAVGVPAEMLRRRPDVRAAERRLAAATARIGQSEAELYPRLSLLGSLGLEANSFSNMFRSGASVYSVGPSLAWNLFDGGARRAAVEVAGTLAEQARIQWQSSVLVALEEVENAMFAFVQEQNRQSALAQASARAERARELVSSEYRQGLVDFQVVLDAERELAAREDELVLSKAAVTRDFALLFKALGGGWEFVEIDREE